jgi:hypothetical protein
MKSMKMPPVAGAPGRAIDLGAGRAFEAGGAAHTVAQAIAAAVPTPKSL